MGCKINLVAGGSPGYGRDSWLIARDSESYAASLVERLLVAVDRLLDFPQYGRRVPELDQEAIREIIVDRYRVIYRLNTHSVDLAAIVHGARDLSTALSNRLQ